METRHMEHPVVHVIFTKDGLPRWFGSEPVRDSEPLDLEELRHLLPADALEDALAAAWQSILITHRRTSEGEWVLRDPVVIPEPTPEEITTEREAQAAALAEAEAARLEAIETEIVRLSGPDQLLRSMGKITIAELNSRVASIRAWVEGMS